MVKPIWGFYGTSGTAQRLPKLFFEGFKGWPQKPFCQS
jgi:hypothetical protein